MREDIDTGQEFIDVMSNQGFIAADIGIALGSIDDQQLDVQAKTRDQFHTRRKTRATQSDNARTHDALLDLNRAYMGVVLHPDRPFLVPAIITVSLDHDTGGPGP